LRGGGGGAGLTPGTPSTISKQIDQEQELEEAKLKLAQTTDELLRVKAQNIEANRINQQLNRFKLDQLAGRSSNADCDQATLDEARARKLQRDLLSAQAELLTLKGSTEVDTDHYRKRLAAAHQKVGS